MIKETNIGGRTCRFFGSDKPQRLLIQLSARHENPNLEKEARILCDLCPTPFLLVAIELEDWMTELMPWPDSNMSRDPIAGKRAPQTLDYILNILLPKIEEEYGPHITNPQNTILGGYSLGGLFSLWASTQTDRFLCIAAASPSVWIRDWNHFSKANLPMAKRIYLSLGDREEHVKNQAISRVGDCLRDFFRLLKETLPETDCTLFTESGNHFTDNPARLARAFSWCMNY